MEVASSHYSLHPQRAIELHWRLCGMDTRGRLFQDLERGSVPIPFPHGRVAPAHTIPLTMPAQPMLCALIVEAKNPIGAVVAKNYIDFLVSTAYPPAFEEVDDRTLVLRGAPADWEYAWWSGDQSGRDIARRDDSCWGRGHGFFEWNLPLNGRDLTRARRMAVLCEASSNRSDTAQTDEDIVPTTLQVFVNEVRVFEGVLKNHPHDSRGVLSYLRGGTGAYGYLTTAFAEDDTLKAIVNRSRDGHIRLRCAVPAYTRLPGGLTIDGAECGRYPIAPTIVVEW